MLGTICENKVVFFFESMPQNRSLVWQYFKVHMSQDKKLYKCIFCDAKYVKNATRMADHLLKCLKSPLRVKKHFGKATLTNLEGKC